MSLIRSNRSLDEIKKAYQTGSADKKLRSYFIPAYQQTIIDILSDETGDSKGSVVRAIIDEWIKLKLDEGNGRK